MPLQRFRASPDIKARAAPAVVRGLCAVAAERRPLSLRGHSMTLETWTPERVEQLRSCVVTGLTCSQIAAQIGVSRNAVIGKLHRLGLSSGRPPGGAARCCPPRVARPRAPSQRQLLRFMWSNSAPATGSAASLAIVDSAQPCSLLDLDRGKCRWPLGEPGVGSGDLTFCGNAAPDGISYCAGHARMAYRVPARRSA
jgi:GcrA cell cycle regulator